MAVSLRPVEENDLQLILEWRNEPEARANSFSPLLIDSEEHKAYWGKRLAAGKLGELFSFIIVAEGANVGLLRLDRFDNPDSLEIHLLVSSNHSGKGYATAAVKLAKGFASKSGFKRLVARVKPDNAPSKAVFINNGFKEIRPGLFELLL